MEKADLILFVTDQDDGFDAEEREIMADFGSKKVIVVCNKSDLILYDEDKMKRAAAPYPVVFLSAKEKQNLETLGETIQALFMAGEITQNSDEWVGNLRHKEAFLRAKSHLKEVLRSQKQHMPLDFQVIDLRAALETLGEIDGVTVSMEILDRIFSEFCIGK
jgi:tRNA modification GTPase